MQDIPRLMVFVEGNRALTKCVQHSSTNRACLQCCELVADIVNIFGVLSKVRSLQGHRSSGTTLFGGLICASGSVGFAEGAPPLRVPSGHVFRKVGPRETPKHKEYVPETGLDVLPAVPDPKATFHD